MLTVKFWENFKGINEKSEVAHGQDIEENAASSESLTEYSNRNQRSTERKRLDAFNG